MPEEITQQRVELHFSPLCSPERTMSSALRFSHQAAALFQDFTQPQVQLQPFSTVPAGIKAIRGAHVNLLPTTKAITSFCPGCSIHDAFTVVDLETTVGGAAGAHIIEIGAVRILAGKRMDTFHALVRPPEGITESITELTGITNEMVIDQPTIDAILPKFLAFAKDSVLVAHDTSFDIAVLQRCAQACHLPFSFGFLDTLELCRRLFPSEAKHGLSSMTQLLHIPLSRHHRALDDAIATAHVLFSCFSILEEMQITGLDGLHDQLHYFSSSRADDYCLDILVQNERGLQHLKQMLQEAYCTTAGYLVTNSLLTKYHDGLLYGSDNESGELARFMNNDCKGSTDFLNLYDYFLILPPKTQAGPLRRQRQIIKEFLAISRQFHKPVIAAGGFRRKKNRSGTYRCSLKSTSDMLRTFSFLGMNTAQELVIVNTNKLAEKILYF